MWRIVQHTKQRERHRKRNDDQHKSKKGEGHPPAAICPFPVGLWAMEALPVCRAPKTTAFQSFLPKNPVTGGLIATEIKVAAGHQQINGNSRPPAIGAPHQTFKVKSEQRNGSSPITRHHRPPTFSISHRSLTLLVSTRHNNNNNNNNNVFNL